MNKKFLSAILFGALMVTSTGTFVSCKDYDDDIENLQGQINNLATKSDVEAKLSQLQGAIDAAKAEALAAAKAADNSEELAALEAEIAALEKCECDVEAMLAKVKESVDADLAAYKTELEELIAQAEGLVGQVADFVTSVELVYSNSAQSNYRQITVQEYEHIRNWSEGINDWNWADNFTYEPIYEEDEDGNKHVVGYTEHRVYVNDKYSYDGESLNTTTVIEKDNTFGPNETSLIKFTKGTQHQRGDKFVVRVSPTNAVLTPEMITLVNSQGAALDIMEVKSVKPFTKLLGRSAANGLWEVEVALKEYDKDTFAAAQWQKGVGTILYAVQVNNTLSTAATRNVISTYDLTLGAHYDFGGLNRLNYFVDNTNIEFINNRTYGNWSKSLEASWSDKCYKEMEW